MNDSQMSQWVNEINTSKLRYQTGEQVPVVFNGISVRTVS